MPVNADSFVVQRCHVSTMADKTLGSVQGNGSPRRGTNSHKGRLSSCFFVLFMDHFFFGFASLGHQRQEDSIVVGAERTRSGGVNDLAVGHAVSIPDRTVGERNGDDIVAVIAAVGVLEPTALIFPELRPNGQRIGQFE